MVSELSSLGKFRPVRDLALKKEEGEKGSKAKQKIKNNKHTRQMVPVTVCPLAVHIGTGSLAGPRASCGCDKPLRL